MPGVFVSYRHSDVGHAAGRLADRLRRTYGADLVFFDRQRESLEIGEPYAEELERRVGHAEVVLAVIGERWAGDGPRLNDASDWVRRELETAFEVESHVVPLLIDRAELPDDLPESIERLSTLQHYRLSQEYFDRDADELIARLRPHITDDRSRLRRFLDRRPHSIAVAAAALVAVVVSASVILALRPSPTIEQMDGAFNIAVAGLDDGDVGESEEDVGVSIGAAVASEIGRQFGDDAVVWGPRRVGTLEASSAEELGVAASDRAAEIGADVVIFGTASGADASSVVAELSIGVYSGDERRPAAPIVVQRAIEQANRVDGRRLDTADDALAAFDQLRLLGPVVRSLWALDRDDPTRSAAILAGIDRPDDTEVAATLDALEGVVVVRATEFGVGGARPQDAIDLLERAAVADGTFAFAELWLLAARYLDGLGPRNDVTQGPDTYDWDALERVRADLRTFVAAGASGADELYVLQARNLLAQISIAESLAGRHDTLVDAERELLAIDAAFDRPPPGVRPPELEAIVMAARSSLGLIADRREDYESALGWFESARELATPFNRAQETANVALMLHNLGRACEAVEEYTTALTAADSSGVPYLDEDFRSFLAEQRDVVTEFVAEGDDVCP